MDRERGAPGRVDGTRRSRSSPTGAGRTRRCARPPSVVGQPLQPLGRPPHHRSAAGREWTVTHHQEGAQLAAGGAYGAARATQAGASVAPRRLLPPPAADASPARVGRPRRADEGQRWRTDRGIAPGVSAHRRAVRRWLDRVGPRPQFIESGGPWANGSVKRFTGQVRDDRLAREIVDTLGRPRCSWSPGDRPPPRSARTARSAIADRPRTPSGPQPWGWRPQPRPPLDRRPASRDSQRP